MENKYLAIICADWNDADYVYRIKEVDEQRKDWLIRMEELFDTITANLSVGNWRNTDLERLSSLLDEIITYEYSKDYSTKTWRRKGLDEEYLEDAPDLAYLNRLSLEDLGNICDFIHDWIPSGYECSCHSLEYVHIYELKDKVH